MIREQVDGYWYFDLGSFNGSYINGARVTASRRLANGDLVNLGEFSFLFEQEGVPEQGLSDDDYDATVAEVSSGDALLFVSDIMGFTTLSERLTPDQLAPIIGSWYSRTELILSEHGGSIDKFIGDCVFAYWTETHAPNRMRALQAAQAMIEAGQVIQQEHAVSLSSIGHTFQLGASLHRGRVAYGRLSSSEFTLLGDSVNLAFRLESLTRQLGANLLLSGDFLEGWPEGQSMCRSLGAQEVKGRQAPVMVYTV